MRQHGVPKRVTAPSFKNAHGISFVIVCATRFKSPSVWLPSALTWIKDKCLAARTCATPKKQHVRVVQCFTGPRCSLRFKGTTEDEAEEIFMDAFVATCPEVNQVLVLSKYGCWAGLREVNLRWLPEWARTLENQETSSSVFINSPFSSRLPHGSSNEIAVLPLSPVSLNSKHSNASDSAKKDHQMHDGGSPPLKPQTSQTVVLWLSFPVTVWHSNVS